MIEVISDAASISKEATKIKHCKNVADVLFQAYPGHLWGVQLSEDSSVTEIRCFGLSGDHGFTLHTDKLNGDTLKRKVLWAGGEILERFGMDRGRYRGDQHNDLKCDRAGRVIFDAA